MKKLFLIITLFFITGCDSAPPTPTTNDVQSHIDDALKSKGVAVKSVKCESYPSTTETAAGRTSCVGTLVTVQDIFIELDSNAPIIDAFERTGLSNENAQIASQWLPKNSVMERINTGTSFDFTAELQYQRHVDKWEFEGNIDYDNSHAMWLSLPQGSIAIGDPLRGSNVAYITNRFEALIDNLKKVENQITNFLQEPLYSAYSGHRVFNIQPTAMPTWKKQKFLSEGDLILRQDFIMRGIFGKIYYGKECTRPLLEKGTWRSFPLIEGNEVAIVGLIAYEKSDFDFYMFGKSNKTPRIHSKAEMQSRDSNVGWKWCEGYGAWQGNRFSGGGTYGLTSLKRQ